MSVISSLSADRVVVGGGVAGMFFSGTAVGDSG
jgi:hypothetical protein